VLCWLLLLLLLPQQQLLLLLLGLRRINILLVIGGQGGNQLAAQLADGCQRRGIQCCIAGVSGVWGR
jgi:6-phosphofructokinase